MGKLYGALLAVIGFIASILFANLQGRKAKENEENKKVVQNVEEINKKKFDVSKLSDSELDKRLQKFKRPSK